MRSALIVVSAALLALGCAHQAGPKSLEQLRAAHDWGNEPGKALNAAYARDVKQIFRGMKRQDVLAAIGAAGYECIYGEGSESYPEPSAQCTTSFATRECQMDWEIFVVTDSGKTTADGSYTRDCVGRDRDWPTAKDSAIDQQLAPPPLKP